MQDSNSASSKNGKVSSEKFLPINESELEGRMFSIRKIEILSLDNETISFCKEQSQNLAIWKTKGSDNPGNEESQRFVQFTDSSIIYSLAFIPVQGNTDVLFSINSNETLLNKRVRIKLSTLEGASLMKSNGSHSNQKKGYVSYEPTSYYKLGRISVKFRMSESSSPKSSFLIGGV